MGSRATLGAGCHERPDELAHSLPPRPEATPWRRTSSHDPAARVCADPTTEVRWASRVRDPLGLRAPTVAAGNGRRMAPPAPRGEGIDYTIMPRAGGRRVSTRGGVSGELARASSRSLLDPVSPTASFEPWRSPAERFARGASPAPDRDDEGRRQPPVELIAKDWRVRSSPAVPRHLSPALLVPDPAKPDAASTSSPDRRHRRSIGREQSNGRDCRTTHELSSQAR